MAQRRHHYEQAFEELLRTRRIPYVAVDEARKALVPDSGPLRWRHDSPPGEDNPASLKSFDFVLYGDGINLLAEVKGRRVGRARPQPKHTGGPQLASPNGRPNRPSARLESWVTLEDIRSLQAWERLFGPEFQAAFLFVYWCDEQPPDGLFQEVFEHRGRWYAVRAVALEQYTRVMKIRSPRWGTMHVAPSVFEQISQPFVAPLRATGA
ncbi:MAG: HYExAFE family protein [Planctomycetota bacterium]|nr:HYExAFE family protein [Planctomycetota bacterium]